MCNYLVSALVAFGLSSVEYLSLYVTGSFNGSSELRA